MTISVGIIEDDLTARQYLTELILTSAQCTLAGTAQDGVSAKELIARKEVDVYLVDLMLPDIDGVEIIKFIKENNPKTNILVLTSAGDADHVYRSLQAGATGYLLKESMGKMLIDEIVSTSEGMSPISPSIARMLVKYFVTGEVQARDTNTKQEAVASFGLSTREFEVLELLASGIPIYLIADKLNISIHTVNQHLRSIYRKMKVRSRAMAVHVAIQNDLL